MSKDLKWEIISKKSIKSLEGTKRVKKIVDILLENRGIKTKREREKFFRPTDPQKILIKDLGLNRKDINKAIERISKAIKTQEEIIIYGDYDADGICATAILWECLYSFTKNVKPYIPNRFEEGYGLKAESLKKLKIQNPNVKLVVTVDNGIVANEAVKKAAGLGIDVIISDHHQKGGRLPQAQSIIHTDKISGSGVAWILARELKKKLSKRNTERLIIDKKLEFSSLELVAIGTIADQMPLLGANRSFAKYGLDALNKTKRPGLLALYEESGLNVIKDEDLQKQEQIAGSAFRKTRIGTYEINYIIAPRINAMGRMEHAIDSLRLLCTKNEKKAKELACLLNKTNIERQIMVDKVVLHARQFIEELETENIIVLADEKYHEGVIGLAASRLVEEFYRPVIVLSKGSDFSKGSARSISGFSIIEVIRKLGKLLVNCGGHPMAAGFSIETARIEEFKRRIAEISKPLLSKEVLEKKLKIDLQVRFDDLNVEFYNIISEFEPTGVGNPAPTFVSRGVNLIDARTVGVESRHLKLKLEDNGIIFDAIAFNMGEFYNKLSPEMKLDLAFNLIKSFWNGLEKIELRIKDLKIGRVSA